MNLAGFFRTHLSAEDFDNGSVIAPIEGVKIIEMDEGKKPVVMFVGLEKGLILNKTNSELLCELYGAETENWVGKLVELYRTKTEFRGKRVNCIRLKEPSRDTPSPAK